MHIKIDDIVEIHHRRRSRRSAVRWSKSITTPGKVLVEGVNRVYKHVRRSQRNPQGGRLSKEMPVQISNVKLVCTSCSKPSRTGARYLDDGSKERFCKSCGAGLGQLAPPRKAYAK